MLPAVVFRVTVREANVPIERGSGHVGRDLRLRDPSLNVAQDLCHVEFVLWP